MQVFHPSANTLSRLTIYGSVVMVLGPVVLTYLVLRSPYQTKVGVIQPQPVPFSHEHHVQRPGTRLPVLPHHGRNLRRSLGCRQPTRA